MQKDKSNIKYDTHKKSKLDVWLRSGSTDSRSLISYNRDEYFRRILFNMLGQWVEDGEVTEDMDLLGGMVEDICSNNAKNYFKL